MNFIKKMYARVWLWLHDYCQHGIYNPYRGLPFNCQVCMKERLAQGVDAHITREHQFAVEQEKAVRLAGEL